MESSMQVKEKTLVSSSALLSLLLLLITSPMPNNMSGVHFKSQCCMFSSLSFFENNNKVLFALTN